jgi:hypothetical protein
MDTSTAATPGITLHNKAAITAQQQQQEHISNAPTLHCIALHCIALHCMAQYCSCPVGTYQHLGPFSPSWKQFRNISVISNKG